jgi:hypothetical protein
MSVLYISWTRELVTARERDLIDAADPRRSAATTRAARKADRLAKRAARLSDITGRNPTPAPTHGAAAQSPPLAT